MRDNSRTGNEKLQRLSKCYTCLIFTLEPGQFISKRELQNLKRKHAKVNLTLKKTIKHFYNDALDDH